VESRLASLKRILLVAGAVASFWTLCSGTGLAQGTAAAADRLSAYKASLTTPPPPTSITFRQLTYVPIYSSIAGAGGLSRFDFSATLSIRNTSATKPLVVERIDYRDTAGNLVEQFIAQPVAVKPYATIEVMIATADIRGGTGASFVVAWGGAGPIEEPVIEAVMIGVSGPRSFSFLAPGRRVHMAGE
jgi:hypothetical protein